MEKNKVVQESDIETTQIVKTVRHWNPFLFWGMLLVASILFLIIFKTTPLIPFRWFLIAAVVIMAVLGITFYFTKEYRKPNKCYVVRVVNIVLAVILLAFSILIPYARSRVSETIHSGNTTEVDSTVRVNLYVMSDEYKNEHKDIFTKGPYTSEEYDTPEEELKHFKDAMFISELGFDLDNQRIAIDKVKEVLGVTKLDMLDASSIQEGAEYLYKNKGEVLILSEKNVNILKGIEEYENFEKETRVIYSIDVEATNPIVAGSSELTKEPFALFFGGNDEEGELTLFGKTDVDMVVVVNPSTHQIAMVSFPRDSFVPNPQSSYYGDKLTHLGVGGIDNTLNALSSLLNVEINNYVLLNFTTYMKIIEALGGVEVENPYAFGFWDNPDIWFEEGKIHLNPYDALLYVRERKTLPDGDFGRTMHQQLVMRAIIEKIASPAIITRFDSLMTAMEGTFLTNLSENAIYGLCQYQLDKNIKWNIVNYRIEGSVGREYCAWAPGTVLSVVYPSSEQINFVAGEIQKLLNGELLTQEEMPLPYGKLPVTVIQEVTEDTPVIEDEEIEEPVIEETPTPIPEETAAPTPEPIPQETATPTPEPTDTPEPTPEPTPESTPEPTPTPDESAPVENPEG